MKNSLSFFPQILIFFVEKLRNKSIISTKSKRKFKNSSIQPRTSRSDFGKISSKSRTTAENIAYRTNQLPVGAQEFHPIACNSTIPQNRQKKLKEKLDFHAKLSGLPIFKLGNDPYVTA